MASNISDLHRLYRSIDDFKSFGVKLSAETIADTIAVEERIINEDVIPALKHAIEDIISQIQREMLLVIHYVPEQGLNIEITKQRSLLIPEEEDVPLVVPQKIREKKSGYSVKPHTKAAKTNLRVKMPDKRIIENKHASQTFCAIIDELGAKRVADLGIIIAGQPLVSLNRQDPLGTGQTKDGYFVVTHSSTYQKKRFLDIIAQQLKIKLEVIVI